MGNGKMDSLVAKEFYTILMEIEMNVNGKMAFSMGLEKEYNKMLHYMKENGGMENIMGEGN